MTAAAWIKTVEALWPGALVEVPGRDPGGRTDGPLRREFVFLPDADRPRLLLPAGLPAAAAAALRRYSHDLGPAQRVSRSLTATAVRTGLPERRLRDRLRVIGGGADSIEDRLGELLGRPVVVSVGLGSARANRKPILHVLTAGGAPVAFVKVGDTPTARQLIADEAVALRYLGHADRSLPGISVPQVLHHGPWQDLGLLVLSALPTSARGWRPRRTPPIAAMRALAAAGGVERSVLADSPYWAGLLKAPAQVTDPASADRLEKVIERVGACHGAEPLDFGLWHGDWTPWNMAWHRGTVQLWDWERSARDVPLGFDLLHYRLQEAARISARPPYESWPASAAGLLEPFGVTGAAGPATVELYILELCVRYQLAAQGPIGDPLRPYADRLLDLLDTHAGRTA